MTLLIIIGVAVALGVYFYIRSGKKSDKGNKGRSGGVDNPNPTDPNYPNYKQD